MRLLLVILCFILCFSVSAQRPIEFFKLKDLPISFIDGSVQHNLIDSSNQQATYSRQKVKYIYCTETGGFPKCTAAGVGGHYPDSSMLHQFERNGKPLRTWPKGAVLTHTPDSLVKTCRFSDLKTFGCGTGGYVQEYHYYNQEYYYDRNELIKIVTEDRGGRKNGNKPVIKTLLLKNQKSKGVTFNTRLLLKNSDTLKSETTCTVSNKNNKPTGVYYLKPSVGAKQAKKIKSNAKKLFHQILISDDTNCSDSTFEAYNNALYERWEKINYRVYYWIENRRERRNYATLDKYSELAYSYTGYEYDKKGRLTKRGDFYEAEAGRIDELKYDIKGKVKEWRIYDFGSGYTNPFNKFYDFDNYKTIWYFKYDDKDRVSSCDRYIWQMNKEHSIDEFYNYSSKPIHITYTFLYDDTGKVTKIKVTSNKTKTCYNTFTFDLNYGFY